MSDSPRNWPLPVIAEQIDTLRLYNSNAGDGVVADLFEALLERVKSARMLSFGKLDLRPGDTLVVKVDIGILTEVGRRHIAEWVAKQLPPGIPVLVVGPGIDLSVVRP